MAPTLIRIPQNPQSVSSGSEGYVPIKWPRYAKQKSPGVLDKLLKGGLDAVGAVVNTISIPQRETFSLLSGDGFVDPYSADAAKYDPSKMLKKGPGRVGGVGGFLLDAVLDPTNLVGAGAAKAAIKPIVKEAAEAAAEGAAKGAAKKVILGPSRVKEALANETPPTPADAVAQGITAAEKKRAGLAETRQALEGDKGAIAEKTTQTIAGSSANRDSAVELAQLAGKEGVRSSRALTRRLRRNLETADLDDPLIPLSVKEGIERHRNLIARERERVARVAEREANRRPKGSPAENLLRQDEAILEAERVADERISDSAAKIDKRIRRKGKEYRQGVKERSKAEVMAAEREHAQTVAKASSEGEKATAELDQQLAQIDALDKQAADQLDALSKPDAARTIQKAGGDLRNLIDGELGTTYGTKVFIRAGSKRIPIALVKGEGGAKVVGAVNKLPFFGGVGRAINQAFNPRAGINAGIYAAGRGASHMIEQEVQRSGAVARDLLGQSSKKSKERLTQVWTEAYDNPLIDATTPEAFREQAAKRAAQAKELASKNPKDAAGKAAVKAHEEAAARLERAADHWDEMDEPSKKAYMEMRRLFDAEGQAKVAAGQLTKDQLVPNYVPTSRITPEADSTGADLINAPKALNTTDTTLLQRQVKQVPQDQEPQAVLEHWLKTTTRARYNAEMVSAVTRQWGKTAEDLHKEFGSTKGWVELSGSDGKVFVPAEIEKSMNNLAALLANPQSSVALVKAMQDFVRRWKALAYAANVGHYVVDTIGDFWNTALRHGAQAFNPARVQRAFAAGEKVEKYFKHLEKNKFDEADALGAEIVRLGNHDYSVKDLAQRLEFGGMRNTGAAVTEIAQGATPSAKALVFRGLGEKGDRFPRGKPRIAKGYMALTQKGGNKRDNLSKRMAWLIALDKHSGAHNKLTALKNATFDVRVSLFDYSELSQFEKRTMRNIAPFYTWTRKNIPYQLRMLGERPAMAIAPIRLQNSQAEGEPNPAYAIPDYARQKGIRIGQLPGPIASLLGQEKGQPFYLNPSMPTFDLRFAQKPDGSFDPGQVLGMVNPLIKAPFELASGKSIGTGAPVSGSFFGGDKGNGLPVLGSRGEYLVKTFGGQPGNSLVNAFDSNRTQPNRIMPFFGSVTGIRGTVVDPEKQTKVALMEAQMAAKGDRAPKAIKLSKYSRSTTSRRTRISIPRIRGIRATAPTSSVKPLRVKKIRAVKTTRRRRPRPVRIKTT